MNLQIIIRVIILLLGVLFLSFFLYNVILILLALSDDYIYVCVCVCVCVNFPRLLRASWASSFFFGQFLRFCCCCCCCCWLFCSLAHFHWYRIHGAQQQQQISQTNDLFVVLLLLEWSSGAVEQWREKAIIFLSRLRWRHYEYTWHVL